MRPLAAPASVAAALLLFSSAAAAASEAAGVAASTSANSGSGAGRGLDDAILAAALEDGAGEGDDGLDDECAADGDVEACAASLLQRRARSERRHLRSDVAATEESREDEGTTTMEPSAAFGREVAQDPSCPIDTGGTCLLMGCDRSRGEVECTHRRCKCKSGFCNDYGVCRSYREMQERRNQSMRCDSHTEGGCRMSDCYSFRGPTQCNSDHQCVCKPGYCNVLGICYRDEGSFQAKVAPVTKEHPLFPGAQGNIRTALVMSGGGTRSQTVSLGVLRALEKLGLMRNVDAISSVSGGSWAAAIYMFAQLPIVELLGKETRPEDLTLEVLDQSPAAMGKTAATHTTPISGSLWMEGVSSHRLWVDTIAAAFLKPFGLESKNSYIAPDLDTVQRIKLDNPQLQDAVFHVPAAGRPKVFVISGAILAPEGYKADENNVVSLQMSPDYSGSPFHPEGRTVNYPSQDGRRNAPLEGKAVGGGLVESFAFGGGAPTSVEEAAEAARRGTTLSMAAPREPLSLAKMVGVSSAGPASALTQVGPHSAIDLSRLNPLGNIWSVMGSRLSSIFGLQEASTYALGDGGNIDNSGMLAMIQRKAQRLVWLINTGTDLPVTATVCSGAKALDEKTAASMDKQITSLFGYVHKNTLGEFLTHNKVFDETDLPPIVCEMAKLRDAGKPVVLLKTLSVKPNEWWGIEGGFQVEVLFVHNSLCAEFVEKLPKDTQGELDRGGYGRFHRFPHFWPVFQTADSTALSNSQVNLLSAQSEYVTLQTADLFRRVLGS